LVSLFLNDHELVKRAELAGPRFVEREFGVERMVKETLDLYGSRRAA
jgi:hypothetical protein